MKIIKVATVLIFVLLFSLNSCKKETNENHIGIPTNTIYKESVLIENAIIYPFSNIKIAFNYSIDKDFQENNNWFIAKFDTLVVINNNTVTEGSISWSKNKDTLIFTPAIPFIINSNISMQITMHWLVYKNHTYEQYSENNAGVFEIKNNSFKLSSLLNNIFLKMIFQLHTL